MCVRAFVRAHIVGICFVSLPCSFGKIKHMRQYKDVSAGFMWSKGKLVCLVLKKVLSVSFECNQVLKVYILNSFHILFGMSFETVATAFLKSD